MSPAHRGQHLDAFCKVAYKGHDGHFLHQPLDLAELHHEPVFVGQVLDGFPFPLVEPQHFHFVLGGQEPHEAFHEIHW